MIDKILLWGLILGMAALWVWNWAHMQIVLRHEKNIMEMKQRIKMLGEPEEQRCGYCTEYPTCYARDTGVIYPCGHFTPKEALSHGSKK